MGGLIGCPCITSALHNLTLNPRLTQILPRKLDDLTLFQLHAPAQSPRFQSSASINLKETKCNILENYCVLRKIAGIYHFASLASLWLQLGL